MELRNLAPIARLRQTHMYKVLRHWLVRNFGTRQQCCNYTWFLRMPTQYDVLCGPVIDYVLRDDPTGKLDIVVLGCSIGAEPYTIASLLTQARPNLDFTIRAYDIDDKMVAWGQSARYSRYDVFRSNFITEKFVRDTFDSTGEDFVVKPGIARHVTFAHADILDRRLNQLVGPADIVCVQNVLVNMPPRVSKRAFRNIITLLKRRSALLIDGMDVGQRARLTKAAGLSPWRDCVVEIHGEGRSILAGWPYIYSGLEPLNKSRADWLWRYATIFVRRGTDEMPAEPNMMTIDK